MAKSVQFLVPSLLIFLQVLCWQPHQIGCQVSDGVDVSTLVSQKQFLCMRVYHGITFAIVRVWRSSGVMDENAVQNIRNGGTSMFSVEGYIFPCFKCKGPKEQIRELLRNLRPVSGNIGTLWLDIESPQSWGSNHTENVGFIQEMVDELKAHARYIGIYTSRSQWTEITGGSTWFRQFPLWYAHYDGKSSFEDFVPFGGWTRPRMKQHSSDVSMCGVNVDEDWIH